MAKIKDFLKVMEEAFTNVCVDWVDFKDKHPVFSGFLVGCIYTWAFYALFVKSVDEVTWYPWVTKLLGDSKKS